MSKRGGKKKRLARKQIRLRRARQRQAKRHNFPQETVVLPEDFRLTMNLPASVNRVAGCIAQLREHVEADRKFGLSIVFAAVRQIDAAAALALIAEIHLLSGRVTLRSRDDQWDPEIRELLADMGLFQFLRVEMQSARALERGSPNSYVQFISDDRVYMRNFVNFRRDIEGKMGEGEQLGAFVMDLLHNGLQEAVTNVLQHAYAGGENPRWWVSASFNSESRDLKVLCYDRGRTIPGTLRTRGEGFLRALPLGLGATASDSALIVAALSSPRTSTGKFYRGKGLPEMAGIIDRSRRAGELSVYSGKGVGRYEKGGDDSPGAYSQVRLETPIRGTLIEWRIRIPPRVDFSGEARASGG